MSKHRIIIDLTEKPLDKIKISIWEKDTENMIELETNEITIFERSLVERLEPNITCKDYMIYKKEVK